MKANKNEVEVTKYYNKITGKLLSKVWYKEGLKHRDDDLPARIVYYSSGKISSKKWCKKGITHRDGNKPASIGYYPSGKAQYKIWCKEGKLHRDNDLPAWIEYDRRGKTLSKEWYKEDMLHRDNALPAYIGYFKTGKINYAHWYKYGVEVSEDFCKRDWNKYPVHKVLNERNAQLRMVMIKLVGIDRIIKEGNCKVLDEIKGLDLYKKHPIGDYYQQGDVLIKPSPINIVGYDRIDERTLYRLNGVKYRLLELDNQLRYLEMTNASHKSLLHIEGVPKDVDSVFKAICFRNKERTLPIAIS